MDTLSPRSRALTLACLLVLAGRIASDGVARAQPALGRPSDPQVAAGVQQVREGDFETAVVTLESAAQRLTALPRPPRDLLLAHLYLGVAQVALDKAAPARGRFLEVLKLEPDLRLSPDEFSPKVIGVFEEARRELARTRTVGTEKPRGSRTPWIVGGVAAGAAGVVALVTRGGDGGATGTVSFGGGRFDTPVLVCPDGARAMPLPFTILLDASNGTSRPVSITAVTAVLRIVASSIPSEIGFGSNSPAMVTPSTVAANGRATLRIDSTLMCDNGAGDSPRFNEWSGHVTVTTSADVYTVDTVDRLRVNIP